MKYLHVLLDADMTLIDFKAAQRNALITTYEKYGFPVNEESIAFYDRLNDSLWKKLERKEITKPDLTSLFIELLTKLLFIGRRQTSSSQIDASSRASFNASNSCSAVSRSAKGSSSVTLPAEAPPFSSSSGFSTSIRVRNSWLA